MTPLREHFTLLMRSVETEILSNIISVLRFSLGLDHTADDTTDLCDKWQKTLLNNQNTSKM